MAIYSGRYSETNIDHIFETTCDIYYVDDSWEGYSWKTAADFFCEFAEDYFVDILTPQTIAEIEEEMEMSFTQQVRDEINSGKVYFVRDSDDFKLFTPDKALDFLIEKHEFASFDEDEVLGETPPYKKSDFEEHCTWSV